MMSNSVRFFVAMSAVVFVGCSSNNRGGTAGTGGHSGGSQGNGGATVSSGSSGGSGGSVGTGGTSGSAGRVGSGGTPGSGGKTDRGGSTGSGGNPASGGSATGGATGSGGAGGAGGRGGTSAVRDAGASQDATTAIDTSACPSCPPMRCAYGSPVDGNGCTVCTCNPAPDGGVDVPTDPVCALPEGCADAGSDTGTRGEAGGSSDVRRVDAAEGVKCGTAVCGWGEFCCNSLTSTCVTSGGACAL
jgi:hypothetical protein